MRLDFDAFDITPAEARARFRWATRQGQPAWLWPATPVVDWQEALGEIERLLRFVLSGAQAPGTLAGDPAAIGLAGYTSGVGPLLGHWSEQNLFSTTNEIAAVLELHLHHNRLRVARIEAATVPIIEALAERNIAVAVLKGAHTGVDYFGAAGIRPASDVDLLVHADAMTDAEAVIAAAGFVAASRGGRETSWRPADAALLPRSLELVHADDPWSIDLHGSLDISAGAGTPTARLDRAAPMTSHSRWGPCPVARVLDQPLLLLHLAIHAGAGLHNLSLLRLTELALVIRQDEPTGRFAWESFLALGATCGGLGYAFTALKLCADLVPETIPQAVLDRCAADAPPAVRRLLDQLTPANAQRIDRNSLAEHAMWAEGWSGRMRQFASDLVPSTSLRALGAIYQRRAWTLIRGKIRL